MTEKDITINTGGFCPLKDRTLICLTGKDRHRLLHSFCTANIQNLAIGSVTEVFVLDGKGKTLWFGSVIALSDRLFLAGHGHFGPQLKNHLDRYIIREDVQLHDLSDSSRQIFVVGDKIETQLSQAIDAFVVQTGQTNEGESDSPSSPIDFKLPGFNAAIELLEGRLVIASAEVAGPGYLIIATEDLAESLSRTLASTMQLVEPSQLERLRIEHQTPWYGIDLNETNLPQELNRDDKAISFTKGCYLGQETVARIDALGHVNQLLVKMKIANPAFAQVGTEIEQDGKKIGKITAIAADDSQWVALGLLRRQFAIPGTELAGGDICVL